MGLFDEQEKTEEPTQRKLDKAREQGDIAQSQELTAGLRSLIDTAALSVLAGGAVTQLAASLERSLQVDLLRAPGRAATQAGALALAQGGASEVAKAGLPLLAVFGLGAALSVLVQRGPMWVPARMAPKPARFDPRKNLGKILRGEGLTRLGLTLLKLVLVGVVVALTTRKLLPGLGAASGLGLGPGLRLAGGMAMRVLWSAAGVLVAVGILDYFLARRRFLREQRMTHQEVRDEHKQDEGDPFLKGRLRALQREYRKRGDMLAAVKDAEVVVTNPTHLAVALAYDRSRMGAPRVVAKGAGSLAAAIRAEARREGVVTLENKPLARALFRTVKVGGEAPPELYQAIASVLAFVYRIRGRGR